MEVKQVSCLRDSAHDSLLGHPAWRRQPSPGPFMSGLWLGLADALAKAECSSVTNAQFAPRRALPAGRRAPGLMHRTLGQDTNGRLVEPCGGGLLEAGSGTGPAGGPVRERVRRYWVGAGAAATGFLVGAAVAAGFGAGFAGFGGG